MMFVIPAIAVLSTFLAQGQCQETLIFSEEFDTLDLSLWKHELTFGSSSGNWEFQHYGNNRSVSYVRDGVLYIKPRLTTDDENFLMFGRWDLWGGSPEGTCTGNFNWGCEQYGSPDTPLPVVTSARIRSGGRFSFRYGRIEVEAQLPKGDWLWPAIWMMPAYESYGGWPVSGEMDIMESRGNFDLVGADGSILGHQHAASTLHWGPFFEGNRFWMTTGGTVDETFADTFHKYEMEWTEFGIISSIDGVPVMQALPPEGGWWEYGNYEEDFPGIDNPWEYGDFMAPFDKEFYFILNVAVGGTNGFFPDDAVNAAYPKPWHNLSPTAMRDFWDARDDWYPTWNPNENNGEDAALKINYIRVYQTL